ncbi:NADH-quinone oxidoreductase, B subunit [Fibrobacter sp. UWT2]|uniref:NADH-quinone oxidoreductase subunit NuoB n=1 Tax=Fibrobacter sp. UWT2 TaxID=1896224 RepID=UPI0009109E91|nr:NADH-quinone oxidoreductase subunit NuoB [Fibrobacter sp. UWT2]SHK73969.1 NADH-quinone oxidoreductase, B subunit [Fibrobacter sp. UWT2]
MGIINLAPKILDPIPGGKYVVNAIDYVVNWARANSIWPLTYGTSCCAIEMMSSSMARYDIARFGSEVFRASPRQADLFIIAGTITRRMAPALQMLWEQMPGPKYVLAMGACTISGGPFIYDNYAVVRGAQNLIPVDVFVPGCPPRPEALFHGLLTLREKILKETCRDPWHEGEIRNVSTMDRYREAAKAWAALERIKDEEMAEARAKFKEENPDYKSSFKPVRVKKEDFPEVERVACKRFGLSQLDIYKKLKAKFPNITVHTHSEDPIEDVVAAMPADRPLEVMINVEDYLPAVEYVKNDPEFKMNYLIDVTAIDYDDHFDMVTQLRSIEKGHKIFFCVQIKKNFDIPEDKRPTSLLGKVPTISHLYPGAEVKEREVYDMFGIDFEGHPDLRRIFLDKDFVGYPLRKDFTHPEIIRRPV